MPAKKPAQKASKAPKKKSPAKLKIVNGLQDTAASQALQPDAVLAAAKQPRIAPKLAKSKTTKKKPAKISHPKAVVSFRHNVLPPLMGILMFLGVLGLLNAQWLQAQYQYRFVNPASATTVSSAPASTDPDAPARIYIPDLSVDAPIVTDVKTYDETRVQEALQRGTLQYGSSVDPGQKGNVIVVGHSSGQLWAPGDYKFVFTLLDKMVEDDRIFIDFKGKRYIYRVSETKVVPPTDLSVIQPTDEPQLTLITCTPVGTSKNRRIIIARQVSPNPDTATVVPQPKPVTATHIPF